MKILVELNSELFKRINEITRGSSIADFIQAAIENQIELENEQETKFIELETKFPKSQKPTDNIEKKSLLRKQSKKEKIDVELFYNPINYNKINPVPLKKPLKNYYIWGQYNKFFTLKFALRYLALIQAKNDLAPINLLEFQIKCAKEASKMKKILNESDEKAQRKWGEAFATGLPDDEEKSQARFIHHFIGYSDSQGNPVGALSDLGFVVIGNNQIALSSHGLAFAQLKNPILDEDPFSPSLFGQEEREFLIHHIRANIPTEWHGIKSVIEWIESGLNTPDSLNVKIATLEPIKWTNKMVNTYRTGMLARMLDLGLITRKKIGLNVNYGVTDFGKKEVSIV